MSYTPAYESLGYIQASALVAANISDLLFDIPNDMGTTDSAGETDLKTNCLIIVRPSRDNEDTATLASSFWPTTDTTKDAAYRGKVTSLNTYYNQCGPEAFWFGDTIDITLGASLGGGSISYTDYSHTQIWRA